MFFKASTLENLTKKNKHVISQTLWFHFFFFSTALFQLYNSKIIKVQARSYRKNFLNIAPGINDTSVTHHEDNRGNYFLKLVRAAPVFFFFFFFVLYLFFLRTITLSCTNREENISHQLFTSKIQETQWLKSNKKNKFKKQKLPTLLFCTKPISKYQECHTFTPAPLQSHLD